MQTPPFQEFVQAHTNCTSCFLHSSALAASNSMPRWSCLLPNILFCILLAPFLALCQQPSHLAWSNFQSDFVAIAGTSYVLSWTGGNETTRVGIALSMPVNCGRD